MVSIRMLDRAHFLDTYVRENLSNYVLGEDNTNL